jgi:hypothetical protein
VKKTTIVPNRAFASGEGNLKAPFAALPSFGG